MQTWTLLRTPPSTLPRYTEFINARYPQIELYYPVHEALRRPAGYRRPIRVQRATFPGYVFAKPDLAHGEHEALRRVPFRVWFVRFGPDIEIIPETVIAEIRRLESNGELNPLPPDPNPPLRAGQRVQVHLPTADIIGIIKRIMQIRVVVDTDFCQITVPLHQVARL